MQKDRDEELIRELKNRLQEDQRLLREIAKQLGDGTEERLEISEKKGRPMYYSVCAGKRKYLKKGQQSHAEWLASASYCQRLMAVVSAEEKVLFSFLRSYRPEAKAEVYLRLSEARKKLVRPMILSDEQFTEEWRARCERSKAELQNGYQKPEGFRTNNGELVRSKSEKILADRFAYYGIPYVYECPLQMQGHVFFPDFTLLDLRTRKTVLWEHFGLLDDPDYADRAQEKIHLYLKSGYIPGKNLIISTETTKTPLNMSDIDILLARFL